MAYQYDEGALFGGATTLDLVDSVLRYLGFAPADYNRYSRANITKALNQSQNEFAAKTNILTIPVTIVVKGGSQNYELPPTITRILSARYYTGTASTDYEELKILDSATQMQRIDSTYRGSAGDPDYLFPAYRSGNSIMIGISPIPSNNGTAFNAATSGVVESGTGWQFAGTITGAQKAGVSVAAYLTDNAGRDLIALGAQPGQMIYNSTEGELAVISKITDGLATNDAVYGTLTHGETWDAADAFSIYLQQYGLVVSPALNKVTTINTLHGSVSDMLPGSGNLHLDCARKPLPLTSSVDAFVCEIPERYIEGVIGGAVWRLSRGSHKGSRQQSKADEGLQLFMASVEECNGESVVEQSESEITMVDYF